MLLDATETSPRAENPSSAQLCEHEDNRTEGSRRLEELLTGPSSFLSDSPDSFTQGLTEILRRYTDPDPAVGCLYTSPAETPERPTLTSGGADRAD